MAEPYASVDVAVWLDQIIVAALLLIPGSYLVWLNSSQFHGSRWVMAGLFAVPAILVAIRWGGTRRVAPSRFDRVVVTGFLAIVAVGFVNAILRSDFPANILSVYGQQLYWIALVVVFLKLTAGRPRTYVLTLIRRYYLFVAAAAWMFALLWIVVGKALPHTDVILPASLGHGTLAAINYHLSLAFTDHGALSDIPRFTFLYSEPRVLGKGLVLGLMLQVVHLDAELRSGQRSSAERAIAGLLIVLGALVLTGSLYSTILIAAWSVEFLAYKAWSGRSRRQFRFFHFGVLAAGVAIYMMLNMAVGTPAAWRTWLSMHDNALEEVAATVHKPVETIKTYLWMRVTTMRVATEFPIGVGMMNLDTQRFEQQYGISTNGALTTTQWFAENAGLLGLVTFFLCAWRLLTVLSQQRSAAVEPEVQAACLLMAGLLVVSALVLDLILPGAQGMLLAGLFIQKPGRRSRDAATS